MKLQSKFNEIFNEISKLNFQASETSFRLSLFFRREKMIVKNFAFLTRKSTNKKTKSREEVSMKDIFWLQMFESV